jgi:hypothetical protein
VKLVAVICDGDETGNIMRCRTVPLAPLMAAVTKKIDRFCPFMPATAVVMSAEDAAWIDQVHSVLHAGVSPHGAIVLREFHTS